MAGSAAELRVLDVASPTKETTVVTLRDERAFGTPLWAADGLGILFSATDANSAQGVIEEYCALRAVDLTTMKTVELDRAARRYAFPVAWDRSAGVIAGEESGGTGDPKNPGPVTYLLFDRSGQESRRVTFEGNVYGVSASPDAKWAAVLWDGISLASAPGTIRVFPLADPTRTIEFAADPQWPLVKQVLFRPGSDALAIWRMTRDALDLTLWQPSTGERKVLPPIDPGGRFRPDGSALITQDGTILEPDTGRLGRLELPSDAQTRADVVAVFRLR